MRWTPPPTPLPAAAAAPTAARSATLVASAQAGPVPSGSARVVLPRTQDGCAPRPAPRAPTAGSTVTPVGVADGLATAARQPRALRARLVGYLLTARRRGLLRDLRRNAEWAAEARAAPTLQARMDCHGR